MELMPETTKQIYIQILEADYCRGVERDDYHRRFDIEAAYPEETKRIAARIKAFAAQKDRQHTAHNECICTHDVAGILECVRAMPGAVRPELFDGLREKGISPSSGHRLDCPKNR